MSELSSVVPPAEARPGRFADFVRRHPLFSYFFLAYFVSWLGWVPVVLSQSGLGLLPFRWPGGPGTNPGILGGFLGPIGSSFLCTAIISGKAGVRQLLRRFILWRVGIQWYVIAIFAMPVLIIVGIFLTIPGALASFLPAMIPYTLLVYAGLFTLQMFISPLIEEPGWRGFALPRLQKRYGPIVGSLILAVLWAGWHLPLFLIGYVGATLSFLGITIPFLGFVVILAGITIIITWVFNNTKESLLLVMMTHASIDSFPRIFLFPSGFLDNMNFTFTGIGYIITALVILLVTRGKLSYRETVPAPSAADLPQTFPETTEK